MDREFESAGDFCIVCFLTFIFDINILPYLFRVLIHNMKMYTTKIKNVLNERKSEQAHIPHAPTLLENAVYNERQFQALVTGNRTKKRI